MHGFGKVGKTCTGEESSDAVSVTFTDASQATSLLKDPDTYKPNKFDLKMLTPVCILTDAANQVVYKWKYNPGVLALLAVAALVVLFILFKIFHRGGGTEAAPPPGAYGGYGG